MAAHSPASLDEPVSGEREPAARDDLLGREDARLRQVENDVLLQHYLGHPPARSREGASPALRAGPQATEIGARRGIFQMHVSRLIRQSLEQLQTIVAEEASRTDAAA
jgi:RNA polymerase sigma-B factor